MSDVALDQQDIGAEDQEAVQTVTIEQFEELKKQNEEIAAQNAIIKKAQSGSDRTVAELRGLLKQQEEEGKSEEQKLTDRITEIEGKWKISEADKLSAEQRSLALQILGEKGKGVEVPKHLDRWIGKNAEETEAIIMEYIQEELEKQLKFKDEFAKNNGRKVQRNTGKDGLKLIDDYSDEEIDAMSPDEFLKIQERSKKR